MWPITRQKYNERIMSVINSGLARLTSGIFPACLLIGSGSGSTGSLSQDEKRETNAIVGQYYDRYCGGNTVWGVGVS